MSIFGYLRKYLQAEHVSTETLEVDDRPVNGDPASVVILDQRKVDEGVLATSLDSTKVYRVDGTIDITGYSFIVPVEGLVLQGFGFNVSFVNTAEENRAIFVSPEGGSGDILFSDIAFTSSGTGGSVFALTDSNGFHAVECQRVNYNGCTSLGYLDGYRQGLEQGTGRFGGTPSLEFRGTWVGGYFYDTTIVRGITDTTYSLFKCAVGQTFDSRFRTNANIVVPANVTVFEMAPENFTAPELLQINGAQFAGPGTVLSGIDETNPVVRVQNTNGIKNTYVGGLWTCTATAVTTVTNTNTLYKIAGTTTAQDLEWFSLPGNNEFTLDSDKDVQIVASFTGSFSSGNNRDFEIVFRIWDNSASSYYNSSALDFSTDGNGNYSNLTFVSPRLTLNLNDRVEIWVKNLTDSTDITLQTNSQMILREI